MRSPRLQAGLAALLTFAATLALLHGCQETPKPTEPGLALVVIKKTLTVSGNGTGNGRVTSSPAGIDCLITAGVAANTGCNFSFSSTVTVTLTAVAKPGHAFVEWLGLANCTGTGPCKVKMTDDRAVKAKFLKGPFIIKISSGTAGVGTGWVKTQTGLTPAINCLITNGTPAATGCSVTYPANDTLTLTATPDNGFDFAGWISSVCGTGSCQYPVIQNQTIPATFSPVSPSTPAVEGRWEPVFKTPSVNVHAHLLPTGKVLFWGDTGDAQLWNPANPGAGFVAVSKTFRMYCSGHSLLADGRLLVAGGTSTGTRGLRLATVFNPSTKSWNATVSMAQGRYYPTVTVLPNGSVLAVSGHDTTKTVVKIPEVWNGSGWRKLTTAPLSIPDPFYPAMFVAPNGNVFLAGFLKTTSYLDVRGTGQWTTVGDRKVANRELGSAVMYAPGKILYAGGGEHVPPSLNPPTASAEVIDLNAAHPAWQTIAPMAFARRQMNATLLADGKVLVTGGTSGPGFNDQAGAVHFAELWNPNTGAWKTMARESRVRTYHSTALLLPDGRVLSSGSGEGGGIPLANSEFSAQIFTPPYLFNANGTLATRPTITSPPSKLTYTQPFTVGTPDAASVTRGTLIRLSSVTHAFNQSQLIYPLTFPASDATPTSVSATAPPDGRVAPPGPYLLFLLNGSGVPSVAKIVMVGK